MIYLKQYGYQRSGTNYLELLLRRACPNVSVLTNTLGSKHAIRDWSHWLAEHPGQQPELLEQVATAQVRIVLNLKCPYGIVWSMCRRYNMQPRGKHAVRLANDTAIAVNSLYTSWLRDVSSYPLAASVRYEQLIAEPCATVTRLAEQLQMPLGCPTDVVTRVEAGGRLTDKPHDRGFWLDRRYLRTLGGEVIRTIRARIDWDLLGYRPEEL